MNLKDIDLDWWIEDTLHRVPQSQREESDRAIEGLPYFVNALTGSNKDDRGNVIPFGTGPHSFKAFQMFAKCIPEPERVLEIGFNLGHGAAALLAVFPRSTVVSLEIRNSSEVTNATNVLNQRYPNRHVTVLADSTKLVNQNPNYLADLRQFQASFIDGAHDLKSILADIYLCRRLGVKHFLMDDVHPRHGDTLEAIKRSGLKLHAIVGANMAICEDIG